VTLWLIKDCGELTARGLNSWGPVIALGLNSGGEKGCLKAAKVGAFEWFFISFCELLGEMWKTWEASVKSHSLV
jgi:hypothetical protein